ncbi:hypothetical protein COY32_03520 [candidate division WWE3 bacterium CG_4_10_14_0_2_um_filter_41_14]|uniref:Uncharacterized protein n=1 Tax=candidate division WWE3 bacterium CG_4_10_14_0_2_um_filter_41_14 TaxID=1975072 RepID=A0A2M7TIQ3_UNCKA|nr:MAG: hypothetical protein COY32_03520 [candidate division WWE3 bacterium CG_4_10_14_0_2_um_filter_41_14]
MTNYTPNITQQIRLDIGKMLIAREIQKTFPDIAAYDKIKSTVNEKFEKLEEIVDIRNFWNLVDSIMMGYELKDVVRLITSENIRWRREEDYQIEQLRFGWGEKIGNFELNNKTAKETTNHLKIHPDDLDVQKKKYEETSQRVNDPILVEKYASDESLHVHDGNGRLLSAIVNNQATLTAYIGAQVSVPRSNHWVPTSFLQRLSDTLTTDALIQVLRESDNAVFEFEDRVVTNYKQRVLEAL